LSVIEFTEATKDYGSKVIGPVTFSVNKSEVVGFLGPNGSGKTSCIRMLLGLMRPTSGSVRIRDIDPVKDHVRALVNVGYSPELPNIQSFLSPRELLSFVSKTLRLSSSEATRQIKDILELVGLSDYIDVKISKFSKGMVQRLSIAQGMMGSPDILVLDEPMIGLDPAGSAHFREVFRDFSKKGGTILLSSHIMQEVESLCTSATMIHKGRILFSGKVEEIIGKVLGSNYIILEAEPLDQRLVEKISQIDGVERIERKNPTTIEIKTKQGYEIRPFVSSEVFRYGSKLYSLNYSENRLERTYIEALRTGGGSD
jgi:ABC-2 type transport system ATP-binding protein